MPRKASLGEQRNEHQLATAKRMGEQGNVTVAHDEDDLRRRLDELQRLPVKPRISPHACAGLVNGLREFLSKDS